MSGHVRTLARLALGVFLIAAGVAHLVIPETFLAQTPTWLPARPLIVAVSGVIEVALGVALLGVRRHRRLLGLVVAAFFVAIFPGNVHQAVAGVDAFGLDSAAARWARLAFQPVLVLWALWSTGVWPGQPGTHADEDRVASSPTEQTGLDPDLRP